MELRSSFSSLSPATRKVIHGLQSTVEVYLDMIDGEGRGDILEDEGRRFIQSENERNARGKNRHEEEGGMPRRPQRQMKRKKRRKVLEEKRKDKDGEFRSTNRKEPSGARTPPPPQSSTILSSAAASRHRNRLVGGGVPTPALENKMAQELADINAEYVLRREGSEGDEDDDSDSSSSSSSDSDSDTDSDGNSDVDSDSDSSGEGENKLPKGQGQGKEKEGEEEGNADEITKSLSPSELVHRRQRLWYMRDHAPVSPTFAFHQASLSLDIFGGYLHPGFHHQGGGGIRGGGGGGGGGSTSGQRGRGKGEGPHGGSGVSSSSSSSSASSSRLLRQEDGVEWRLRRLQLTVASVQQLCRVLTLRFLRRNVTPMLEGESLRA